MLVKPVFQEIISAGEGDCFSACLASLLELPLYAVPKFRKETSTGSEMMAAARQWCKENFGLSIVTIQMENFETAVGEDIRLLGAFPGTPCIAGGVSPNLPDCHHAVVGELDEDGMNFQMTHDPNPSGKGIAGRPKFLYFLVPLNPQNYGKNSHGK